MTHLGQLMLEELRRRNLAETTIRTYLHGVEHFSRYFHRQPDQLGPEHIRQYQAALFTKFKFSPNTVGLRLATLRFFYIQVLKRRWSIAETPYPKKVFHLPEILSPEEVAHLIDAADSSFHRILLMTLYATGARRAEAAHLKVSDIDSQRMVVHIREGNGGKDRDVMLSPKLLDALRVYWRGLRRKPADWLFPGNRWHTASYPVTTKVLWTACQNAAERAGLAHKHIHPHTLRHCFATHLLEAGAEIGFFSLLHSWDQRLQFHPHVHCVLAAGGLAPDHSSWIPSRLSLFLLPLAEPRIFPTCTRIESLSPTAGWLLSPRIASPSAGQTPHTATRRSS